MADPENNVLYGVTDPWNYRPLHMGRLKDGKGYVFSSETVATKDIVEDSFELGPGEGWRIVNGEPQKFFHDPRVVEGNPHKVERQSCIFELIYFARPESTIFGVNVGEFRRACGEELARLDFEDGFIPDIVVPVRNSGTVGAEGYSRKMIELLMKNVIGRAQHGEGISQSEITKIAGLIPVSGLQTNAHGRIFIESEDRQNKARKKFSVDTEVVAGRSIALIDDSIVRGDTSTVTNEMLLEAGAREVHNRSLSPKIISECYYGIDFADREQLIAAGRSEEEIANIINADSIRFLPIDSMMEIADRMAGHTGFCTSCFTGEYPNPVNPDELIMRRS
jgi:amidophosphoribosyltransferase